ncbi:hypothetical protein HMPREF1250_1099 [Megasphaera vaginalis (ex Srinivasan et al. 2021)]|uniref:Uncharacterized protein n=1 Tax=Megasphaera vaginalis (ex Srinivasan et al. 2021) TaxID=1111454 RepID=U7UHM6_9FIRM|nr:hypothetical protein HMPREF1250_1099 [Megasphaera vaginalis (ex Srinivasan et al. 2021)]
MHEKEPVGNGGRFFFCASEKLSGGTIFGDDTQIVLKSRKIINCNNYKNFTIIDKKFRHG